MLLGELFNIIVVTLDGLGVINAVFPRLAKMSIPHNDFCKDEEVTEMVHNFLCEFAAPVKRQNTLETQQLIQKEKLKTKATKKSVFTPHFTTLQAYKGCYSQ